MAQTSAKSKRSGKKLSKLAREIREEARALNLTEREYYRLTLAISKTLRSAITESGMSAKDVLGLFDSPIVGTLIRSMLSTVVTGLQSGSSDAGDTTDSKEAKPEHGQPPVPPVSQPPARHPMPNQPFPHYAVPYPPKPMYQAPPAPQGTPQRAPQGAEHRYGQLPPQYPLW
ncbi:hypothetical protein [Alicyclobacillus acidiphilus]|uniref:hypothetical protein n=1 Tax=Alicyclobacillus acidiphilus TaxID=182455 RepID=UPI00082E6FD7|nr:hypothetical protein [Alicyclobacillus acidiphilus]